MTCYSGPKVAVLHAKTAQEGWGHRDLKFCAKVSVLHAKTADEGWDP